MFRPVVDAVAARLHGGPRRVVSAALAAMVLSPAAFSAAVVSADAVSAGNGDVAITAVELLSAGSPLTQTESAEGVTSHGQEPVDVVGITIDDGASSRLVPRFGAVTVSNLGFPADVTGVAVSENGAQTPINTAGFGVAVERVFASSDLRDYVRSDDLSRPGSDWGHDYDVVFDGPLDRSDHLLIQERNGNSRFSLLALDAQGQPIAGASMVDIEPAYGWNTGVAPGDRTPGQPFHLSVVKVEAFLVGTDVSAVHGFRIDNDDEADIKLTALVPAVASDSIIGISTASIQQSPAVADHSVALIKSVYAGHDGGARCADSKTFTEAGQTDPVTYCFLVTNTGTSALANIAVSDPLSGVVPIKISADSDPLQPGQSARYYLEATPPPDDADGFTDDTYINTASASATPVDETGAPIESAGPVAATAEAVVFPAEAVDSLEPQVSLMASVYSGTDGGAGCPAAKWTVTDLGAAITYCYTVTNTGNTHLDSIGLADSLVDGSPILLRTDSQPLAPGQSAYYYLDSTTPPAAIDGFVTASVVTANAVDEVAADLVGLDDVTSNDGARVEANQPQGPTEAPAAPAPAPAPAPDAAPAPAPVVPQSPPPTAAQTTPGASPVTGTEAPTELAYTGWESWLIGALGVALIAGGWLLMNPDGTTSLRTALQPVRMDYRRTEPDDAASLADTSDGQSDHHR